MSKTFKANESTSDARVIKVGPWTNPGVELIVELGDRWGKGIVIPPEDAPALALAVLEAAGVTVWNHSVLTYGTKEHLENIAMNLKNYIEQEEQAKFRAIKEAADREALESEAWVFYVSSKVGTDVMAYASMSEMDPSIKARWVAVARKARELHKAKS